MPPPVLSVPPVLLPELPPLEEPPFEEPPLEEPPLEEPPFEEPALPPFPVPSRSSLSPLQPTRAVAPRRVAPNANVAARPRRVVGRIGGGVFSSERATLQNGQCFSLTRT